jgi:hypothetical protein
MRARLTSRDIAGAAQGGAVGFHGGKVEVERPRVHSKATGKELPLPSW